MIIMDGTREKMPHIPCRLINMSILNNNINVNIEILIYGIFSQVK